MQIQDSFLLEEVRCGFFIPADVKQAWAADMEVLLEIDRVCRKHDIQYFADWGTLLGAVRHGGYIPWDDDLDIVMKREDYIKFITVARRDMEKGFDVRTFRNHDDNWLFMGKVINQNSFSFEKEQLRRFHNFPYIASVDVFVLDYVYRDSQKEKERRELCKYILAAAEAIGGEGSTSAERERLMLKLEERCGRRLERRADGLEQKRYLYGEVEKLFACVSKQESDGLSQLFPWGLLGTAPKFPTEYYEKAVELPFEGINMPVPFAYDKMLRQRYGDYLQPVKTGGAHDYPFFEGQRANLQKVLDFPLPEFWADRDMLCRGEREREKKELSYKAMAKECITALWELLKQLSHEGCNPVQAVELLQESQQLAVDLGNLLEQMPVESEGLISLLEQYCDELYAVYEQIGAGEAWRQFSCKGLEHIAGCLKEELERRVFSRKTVLLLPVLAKDWGSLHPLWQEAEENESCDVYVVPLPYYYKDYDNTPRRVCCETEEFASELGAADYHLLTQEYLTLLHPECIIIQNPYDEWHPSVSVPEQFYALELRKYTDELIYVPPFTLAEFDKSNEREYANMKYYVTMPGVTYADKVSVQSENMRRRYVEKLTEFAGEDTREIWERRIRCAAEEISVSGQRQTDKSAGRENGRRLLYGISYGVYAEDKEKARAKLKSSLAVIAKSGLSVEILLYPNTAVTSELRREITDTVVPCACLLIPEGAECRAEDYSAYYGDGMPVVLQFRNAEKPVLIRDVGI